MTTFIEKVKHYLEQNHHELHYFWKYAVGAKLHFWNYHSKKVILFRLDLIGDCTMFTSSARAIRDFYRDSHMTVVCLEVSRPVFERLGIFNRIITLPFKPEAVKWELIRDIISEIREDTYNILLQPQFSKFPIADVLAAATRCNKRFSIAPPPEHGNSNPAWIKMTRFLYNRMIPSPEGNVSEFDYYGAFVRGICNADYRTEMPTLPCRGQTFIQGNYYVLYPGGSLKQKLWPADRFAKIADYVYQRTGFIGVILGAGSEQWISDKLKGQLSFLTSLAMIDLTGKTSMSDVIDIIGNAQFVVSNDTSGVHIAAATNTPSVATVGGWLFGRFLPYHIENVKPGAQLPLVAHADMPCFGCKWAYEAVREKNSDCLRSWECDIPCMCIDQITVEQVKGLVDQILNQDKRA